MRKLNTSAACVGSVALALTLASCANSDDLDEAAMQDGGFEEESVVTLTTYVDETVVEYAPEEEYYEEDYDVPAAEQGAPSPELACDSLSGIAAGSGRQLSDCDGDWAHAFTPNTDDNVYYMRTGSKWVEIEPDGSTFTGFPCYDTALYAGDGAPSFITDNMLACD